MPSLPSAHRLFFALAPTPAVLAEIESAAETLGVPAAGGRRTRPEKLHLTMAFLGDFDAAAGTSAISQALVAGAHTAGNVLAFDFVLDQAFSFSGARPLWLLGGEAAPFKPLHVELMFALAARQLVPRDAGRPFLPHVTLLRDARAAAAHVDRSHPLARERACPVRQPARDRPLRHRRALALAG
jgi:2'-5' RNA ligase